MSSLLKYGAEIPAYCHWNSVKFRKNTNIPIEENNFENVDCKMIAILPGLIMLRVGHQKTAQLNTNINYRQYTLTLANPKTSSVTTVFTFHFHIWLCSRTCRMHSIQYTKRLPFIFYVEHDMALSKSVCIQRTVSNSLFFIHISQQN